MTSEAPGGITTTHSSARRSRVIEWHDPAPGTAAGMSMPGIEYLQAMREGRLPLPPITDLLNLDLMEVDEGRVVFTCVPDESMYNAIGMIHGGVLCALLDSAASFALLSTLPEGKGLASVEIKVNYLRAVLPRDGKLTATGTVVRAGSRIGFTEGIVHNAAGAVVATASSTLLVFDR